MDWHFAFSVWLIALLPGLLAYAWGTWRAIKRAERWNNTTTPEEIQALLPPGHRYDPETRLCYPPEEGALPYRRGEMLVS
jgi:hypothetical protein